MNYRIEQDSMGQVKVPADKYWGAQTQRSYENFVIGSEKMPKEIIYAFAILKKSAAKANCLLGKLSEEKYKLISAVCNEILEGQHDRHSHGIKTTNSQLGAMILLKRLYFILMTM